LGKGRAETGTCKISRGLHNNEMLKLEGGKKSCYLGKFDKTWLHLEVGRAAKEKEE
jgi:hypothetical protein